jgi:hypothetical protein
MAEAKEAVAATARIFWLYEALALAAALLAFLPDRSGTYSEAIGELRRLAGIHFTADEVDSALNRPARNAIGKRIFDAVQGAGAAHQITLSKSLEANSTYFLVDEGPQALSFGETPVGSLIEALDAYSANPRYVILAPQPDALNRGLRAGLEGLQGVITSITVPCNYAPDRCQADVYVNPNGDVVGAQRDLQFFVSRTRVPLQFGVKDLVESKYPALKDQWLDASALKRVRDDVAELPPAAAIAKLQELRKNEDRPLSIFDVSLSGTTARLAAPVALAMLAFAAWASASGLAQLRLPAAKVAETLFLPLIRSRPAAFVRVAALAFPIIVTEGLLVRAWNGANALWWVTLGALLLQSCATLALFDIFSRLREPDAPGEALRRMNIAAAAAIFLSLLASLGWSLHSGRKAVDGAKAAEPDIGRTRTSAVGAAAGALQANEVQPVAAEPEKAETPPSPDIPLELPKKGEAPSAQAEPDDEGLGNLVADVQRREAESSEPH